MLRWFREYNKFLLVFLGSLLMVVFLIEGAISGIMPQAEDQTIGRLNGEKILLRDQMTAGRELQALGAAVPELTLLAPRDPVQWMLMVRGAEQAGISASNQQVATLLGRSRTGGASVAEIARRANVSAEDLTNAVRHWLMVQQYVELVLGLGHLSLDQRMASLDQGLQYLQMGLNNPQLVIDPARGQPRISRPLLERFLQDQQATVTVQAVAIRPERELPSVATPDDKTIQALYDEYKDELPGGEKGYGLGYKLPDRVKLEYLTIPLANAKQAVTVEESQALAYYDQNPQEFLPRPAAPAGQADQAAVSKEPRPYLEVREEIRNKLIEEAARNLVDRIAKAAQNALVQNSQPLPVEAGFRKITSDWTPTSLTDLAKQLEERFGVQLEVRRINDQWLTLNEVQALPGIGRSSIELGQQSLPTALYIASTRELNPPQENPATTLRLQVYMPSQPVKSFDGNAYLFRLTDASSTHTPALADIRSEVEQDARRIAAYKKLVAQMDQWKAKADQPLASVARELDTNIIGPTSFNRRDTFGGTTQVPQVQGIGRSPGFVDQVFDLALKDQAATSEAGNEEGPAAAIAVDDKLTVYLVRVVDFQPMSRRDFDQQLGMSFNQVWINLAMTQGLEEDPFSIDNLSRRVGYVPENPPVNDDQESAAGEAKTTSEGTR